MSGISLGLATIFCGLGLASLPNVAWSQPTAGGLPSFAQIETTVQRQLAANPQYQQGDLLSRGVVDPIFDLLSQLGWNVADRQAILSKLPADSDFVVNQLRSGPRGPQFMRQVARTPLGYDQLFRLAALPHGRHTIVDLIRTPGGSDLIDYMATTSGGKRLGQMLSHSRPADAHKPTGMIYTEEQLIDRLRESYQAVQQ